MFRSEMMATINVVYFEFETVLKFYNLGARTDTESSITQPRLRK